MRRRSQSTSDILQEPYGYDDAKTLKLTRFCFICRDSFVHTNKPTRPSLRRTRSSNYPLSLSIRAALAAKTENERTICLRCSSEYQRFLTSFPRASSLQMDTVGSAEYLLDTPENLKACFWEEMTSHDSTDYVSALNMLRLKNLRFRSENLLVGFPSPHKDVIFKEGRIEEEFFEDLTHPVLSEKVTIDGLRRLIVPLIDTPWNPLGLIGRIPLLPDNLHAVQRPVVDHDTTTQNESSVYHTAASEYSKGTLYTASSEYDTSAARSRHVGKLHALQGENEYAQLLQSKKLWPIDPMTEQNWSGRGQHVEFKRTERNLLNSILEVEDTLGSTSTAIVESIRCRRILLARKTIRCDRRITKEKAIDEVVHLTRLNHSHIVRVIGTYIIGDNLSILLYPVAEWNLETFLSIVDADGSSDEDRLTKLASIQSFFGCLAHAIAYIHGSLTKHMDIKPQNILVRHSRSKGSRPRYKIYVADFGIARSYISLDVSETEGPTTFTRKYAAPEVVDRQKRGLPADIFSLGCVFLEMLSVLASTHSYSVNLRLNTPLQELRRLLAGNQYGDTSYQANILECHEFMARMDLDILAGYYLVVRRMLDEDPSKRPSASEVIKLHQFGVLESCCTEGAEPLEAVQESLEDDTQ